MQNTSSPLALKAALGISKGDLSITFYADGQLVASARDAQDCLVALERLLAHPFHHWGSGARWSLRIDGIEAATGTPGELAAYVREAVILAEYVKDTVPQA